MWALIHMDVIKPLSGSLKYGVYWPFVLRDVSSKHCFSLCINTPYLFIVDEKGNVVDENPISLIKLLIDKDGMYKKTFSDEEFEMAFNDGLTLSRGDGAIKVLCEEPAADYKMVMTEVER